MHQLDTLQSGPGRTKSFETEHRPNNALDGPVVLFNQVVQILLADLDFVANFFLECIKSGLISAALVDRDFVRQAVLPYRFPEKAQRGLLIAVDGEQEIDGLACFVDGAVEISPLAFDFDVRLVNPPARADWALVAFPENRLQLWREFLNPAVDVGMIDRHAALRHHLFQIPVAQRVSQIPTDASQDDSFFDTMAFEVDHAGKLSYFWGA